MKFFDKLGKNQKSDKEDFVKDSIKQILNDGQGLFYSRIKISDNIEKEESTGYLFCKNSILGHVGAQKYDKTEVGLDGKGAIEVVREEVDVFDEESMSSFDGKPLTLYHPDVLVDSKNIKEYSVGHIKNVRRDGDNLVGDLVVQDSDAVELVESGKLKDLSLGYQAKLTPMADGRLKQENIVINHLALVEEGRAINARIVDENSIAIGEKADDNTKLNDMIHRRENSYKRNTVNEYDDETGEETSKTITEETSKNSAYERLKSEYRDQKENKKPKGENEGMEKNYSYYLKEFKAIREEPKSDFRDGMYKALNDECKEALGVDLPPLEVATPPQENVVENSVGFRDSTKEQEDEENKNKKQPLIADAKAEEVFLQRLYRKMDDPKYAEQLGKKTYHDVLDFMEGKGEL